MMPPAQGMAPQLPGPQLPSGYNMLDAFRSGNEVQLIARATGYPLMMRNGAIFGNGGFVKNDCGFQTTPLTTPTQTSTQNCATLGNTLSSTEYMA
jgi:hypothetical protein